MFTSPIAKFSKLIPLPTGVLGRGALNALLINGFAILLGFCVQVYIVRMLGREEYGTYAYTISWIVVAQILAVFGADSVLLRFIPEYAGKEELKGRLQVLSRWAVRRVLLYSASIGLPLAACIFLFGDRLGDQLQACLLVSAFGLPLFALLMLRQAYCRGFKRIAAARLPDVVFRTAMTGAGLAIVSIWVTPTASIAMIVFVSATAIALGAGYLMFINPGIDAVPNVGQKDGELSLIKREWAIYGIGLLGITLTQAGLGEVDKLLLGALRSVEDVGTYAVSVRLANFCSFGTDSLLLIAVPMLSEYQHTRSKDDLQILIHKISIGMAGLTAALAIFLLVAAQWLIPLYGPAGHGALGPFAILLVGHVMLGSFGPCGSILAMGSSHRELRRVLVVVLIAVTIISSILISLFGVYGAALSGMLSLALRNVVLSRIVRSKLGLESSLLSAVRWYFGERKM